MISSVHGNAGWLPASHASQVASPEVPGEMENDGDRDDAARRVNAAGSQSLPRAYGKQDQHAGIVDLASSRVVTWE